MELPYCIELWINYLNFKINTISNNLLDILNIFESARSKIGLHFYSNEFYQLYLDFLTHYSNFDNDKYNFKLKKLLLLRMIIEIPCYNYQSNFEAFLTCLNDEVTFQDLPNLIPEHDLSHLKQIYKNDLKLVKSKLKTIFTNTYITTQFKTYQLFRFEKKFSHLNFIPDSSISINEFNNWLNYLDFIQLNKFSNGFVILAYERCLLANSTNPKIWLRYSDYYISKNKFNSSKQILNRGIKLSNNIQTLLIKLIDLEIYTKNILKAKNLCLNYLKKNYNIPLQIYEKLINLEHLINNNESYLIDLFDELIDETGNDWFFKIIPNYSINCDLIFEFFNKHLTKFNHSSYYWNAFIFIMIKFNKFDSKIPIEYIESNHILSNKLKLSNNQNNFDSIMEKNLLF